MNLNPIHSKAILAGILVLCLAACSENVVMAPAPAVDPNAAEGTPEETTEDGSGTTPSGDWAGKPIAVKSEGAITIIANPGTKRVTAEVEAEPLTAGTSPNTQPTPFVTIDDKKATTTVSCVRAGTAGRGCKHLTVTIPAGSEDVPLALSVTSAAGALVVSNEAITVRSLTLVSAGSVSAKIKPIQGATIDVSGSEAIELAVPADFTADQVVLTVAGNDLTRIDTAAFPGMVSGKPFGEPGVGAKLLKIVSTGKTASSVVRLKRL